MSPIRPSPPPMPISLQPQRVGTADHGLTSGAKVSSPTTPAGRFARLMIDEVQNVNQMQHQADDNVHSLLTGGDVNEAEVLTSVQKADLAFRMLLQVRNKMVEAYREIQQIQI